MERKERKIGELFKDGNTLLETVKYGFCEGCFYYKNGCSNNEIHGPCCEYERRDEENVIFKEVKDMKEEKLNKDEHFYIWGVPNRGIEVAKLLESKGIEITNTKDKGLSDSRIIIYEEDGICKFIQEEYNRSIVDLITSNWTELKLPYKPKDKELVWAYYEADEIARLAIFFDAINGCCFSEDGNRNGDGYDNYAPFEGEYPEWAKDALSKLED